MEADDPLWKRVLLNEFLWVVVAAIVVLGAAFFLATAGPAEETPRTGQRGR